MSNKRKSMMDKLRIYWSKKENDIMYYFPLGVQTSADSHWLYYHIGRTVFKDSRGEDVPAFLDELVRRGYDIKTIKFSVEKDPKHPRWQK